MALRITCQRSAIVRVAPARSGAFSLAKARSIGLKSESRAGAPEEAPKRADHPAFLQLRPQLGKGHVRRLGHEAEDDLAISLDPTAAAIPALSARPNRATRLEPLMPSH